MKFNELGLSSEILESIERVGFEEATPIQAQTIPLALDGKDVIGQAQTGTGKTAAFGLPTLQKMDVSRGIQTLIIAPTRELAVQTQEELFRLGRDKHVKVQAVYGGADISRQIRALKNNPQIVVGTPGRLLDHIKRKTLNLSNVTTLVLDEADEMLNMGFLEDIEAIIENVPETRQTLLFSATMPDAIKRIGVKFMNNPEHVKIKAKEMTADLIDQYYIRVKEFEKFDLMTRLLDVEKPELTIVFGRTKRRVDELSRGLEARGFNAEGIHGDLSQQKRMSVLRDFKNNRLDILVATDVAARGLDISGVSHVINYDIPQDPESYVHRIGRTGRAGKDGVSITFVTANEIGYLHVIEDLTKKRMSPMRPPTEKEAFVGSLKSAIEEIDRTIEQENDALEKFAKSAEKLLTNHSPEELAAVLLKTLAKDPENQAKVEITPERPLTTKRGKNNRGGGNSRGNRGRNDNRKDRNFKDKYRKDKKFYDKKRGTSSEKKQGFVIRNKGNK
ncbi:MAG: DEAD/DEAH box helicase [Streptococcaceae bacterium]|nr:DEAD/DEAH box helicase [Streptococcaceae bacterium]